MPHMGLPNIARLKVLRGGFDGTRGMVPPIHKAQVQDYRRADGLYRIEAPASELRT